MSLKYNKQVTIKPTDLSDHVLLDAQLSLRTNKKSQHRPIRSHCSLDIRDIDFYKGTEDNWSNLSDLLATVGWNLDQTNVNERLNEFFTTVLNLCKKSGFPTKKRDVNKHINHSRRFKKQRRTLYRKIARLSLNSGS